MNLKYFKPAHTLPDEFVEHVKQLFAQPDFKTNTMLVLTNIARRMFHLQGCTNAEDFSNLNILLDETWTMISVPNPVTSEMLKVIENTVAMAMYLPMPLILQPRDDLDPYPKEYFEMTIEGLEQLLNDEWREKIIARYKAALEEAEE